MSEKSGAILPRKVQLKAEFVDEENVAFEYTETFRPEEAELGDRTFEVIQPLGEALGLSLSRPSAETIVVSGTVPSTTLGNMMLTEWMCWSTIGEMRMRDFFIGSSMGGVQAGKDYGLEQGAKALKDMADGLADIHKTLESALDKSLESRDLGEIDP